MPAPTHTPLTKTHATCHRELTSATVVANATSRALLLLLSTSALGASVCQRPVVVRSRTVTRSALLPSQICLSALSPRLIRACWRQKTAPNPGQNPRQSAPNPRLRACVFRRIRAATPVPLGQNPRQSAPNPRQSGAESANRVFRAGGLKPVVPDKAGA